MVTQTGNHLEQTSQPNHLGGDGVRLPAGRTSADVASITQQYQEVFICKSFPDISTYAWRWCGLWRTHSHAKCPLNVKKPKLNMKTVQKHEQSRKISNVRFEKNRETSPSSKFLQHSKISKYRFKETQKDLIDALKNVLSMIRWPKKIENPSDKKDTVIFMMTMLIQQMTA